MFGHLLVCIHTCQLLGLFAIVDKPMADIIANQVVLSCVQDFAEFADLPFKELDNILGLTITKSLVLTGKNFVKDVERVVADAWVIS